MVPALAATPGAGRWTLTILAAIAVAAVAAMGPAALLDPLRAARSRLADPSPRGRAIAACVVAFAAFAYLALTAHLQGRDLFPKTHDDQSYLLQMRMLAGGRLWMPQHPLADFFDTFYVLARPVYASLYFPGAALLYVPTIWLGLPTWFMPALVAGAIVGLSYRVIAELIDGSAGLLAALVLVTLEYFRVYSVLLTSHEPVLLLGLAMTWAWLRWRQAVGANARLNAAWRWALLIGVLAGWAAITRPADAACLAAPIGLAMLVDLLRRDAVAGEQTPKRRGRRVAITAVCLGLGAAPFLALQIAFNLGVTGRAFDTPYAYYLRVDQPNTSFGFHPYDPAAKPQSVIAQKQTLYRENYVPYVRRHQPDRVLKAWATIYGPMAVDTALPTRALAAVLPVGVLALVGRRRWAVAGAVPLFVLVYVGNTFFLEHYAVVVAPATILVALLGLHRLAEAVAPKPRWAGAFRAGLSGGLALLCLASLPEASPLWGRDYAGHDETFAAPLMRAVRSEMPAAVLAAHPKAVVLFRYTPGQNVQEEPVYNTESAWPDDSAVICAHDLGERNVEIFRYYAKTQPDRFFYRWDRATGKVDELGFAKDLEPR